MNFILFLFKSKLLFEVHLYFFQNTQIVLWDQPHRSHLILFRLSLLIFQTMESLYSFWDYLYLLLFFKFIGQIFSIKILWINFSLFLTNHVQYQPSFKNIKKVLHHGNNKLMKIFCELFDKRETKKRKLRWEILANISINCLLMTTILISNRNFCCFMQLKLYFRLVFLTWIKLRSINT